MNHDKGCDTCIYCAPMRQFLLSLETTIGILSTCFSSKSVLAVLYANSVTVCSAKLKNEGLLLLLIVISWNILLALIFKKDLVQARTSSYS